MARPLAAAQLAATLIVLLSAATSICEGQSSCSIFPFQDSWGDDFASWQGMTPAVCADKCFADPFCIAFVVTYRDNVQACYIKHKLNPIAISTSATLITTGSNLQNCQALFSS